MSSISNSFRPALPSLSLSEEPAILCQQAAKLKNYQSAIRHASKLSGEPLKNSVIHIMTRSASQEKNLLITKELHQLLLKTRATSVFCNMKGYTIVTTQYEKLLIEIALQLAHNDCYEAVIRFVYEKLDEPSTTDRANKNLTLDPDLLKPHFLHAIIETNNLSKAFEFARGYSNKQAALEFRDDLTKLVMPRLKGIIPV